MLQQPAAEKRASTVFLFSMPSLAKQTRDSSFQSLRARDRVISKRWTSSTKRLGSFGLRPRREFLRCVLILRQTLSPLRKPYPRSPFALGSVGILYGLIAGC